MDNGNESSAREPRRRRWQMNSEDILYFLLKPGSTTEKLELDRQVLTEKEALVQSFQHNQPFATVVLWNAVPDQGEEARIVKQTIKHK